MNWRRRIDPGVAMGWRHVLFANWPVDPAVVEPHLPAALSVDTYDGRAWLSVVPFTNVAVRPPRLPRLAGFRLPELNLRTYVTPRADAAGGGAAGDRPPEDGSPADAPDDVAGVYFFSLDADGLLGVVAARLFHHLPYYYASIDLTVSGDRVRFTGRRRTPGARPVHYEATYGPTGERFESEPGSLAAFLTERHRYYTEAPDGSIRYASVHHERWPLYEAEVSVDRNSLFRANGFAHPEEGGARGEPVHLYSPQVDTVASPSRELRGG